MNVIPISAFTDNYIWLIQQQHKVIIVDPGDATPVLDYLQTHDLTPEAILITHKHPDHIGGINDLLAVYDIPVYGPKCEYIPQITNVVEDKQKLSLLGFNFEVLAIPGHTLEHICYIENIQNWLFCGDTIFSAGCGYLFEGTAATMQQSIAKLAELPAQTAVYCSHEYTVNNLYFALEVEPENTDIQEHLQKCLHIRKNQQPTLPSTIEQERKINPFMRLAQESVIMQALNQGASSEKPEDVFATIRQWKNQF